MSARLLNIFLVATLTLISAPKAAEKPLVFFGDKDYPPIAFLENGVAKGMDVDLVTALARPLGREVRVDLMDWNLAQERMLKGDADGLIGMSVTEERRARFDFASPTFTRDFSLVLRENDFTVHSVSDLTGKKVGVTAGGFPRRFLEAQNALTLIVIKHYREGFDLLLRGEIDVMAADRWVAAYLMEKDSISGVTILEKPFATAPLAIAVRKGNATLLKDINHALLEMTQQGTISEIEAHWRPHEMVFYSRAKVRSLILRAGALGLALLLAVLAVWIGTLRKQIDIRKNAEKRLRTLTDASFEGIGVCEDGIIIDVNDQLLKMLGYQRSDLIGKPVIELVAPHSREAVRQATQEERCTPYEHDAIRKDGTTFPVEVCGRTLATTPHRVRVTAVRDISERKRAEEALRRSEERFARFFASAPVATAVTQPKRGGLILTVNEQFTKLLGYTEKEAVGSTTVGLGLFANQPDRERVLRLALEKGEVKDFETQLRAKNGSIVVGRLSAHLTEIDGELLSVASFIDMTQNKRAEEELRASREQLRALAGRLQAVREEERTRIAREIHDVLAQELTRMKIDLGWLTRRLSTAAKDLDPESVRARLDTLNQLADSTITTVQKIAADLRPVVLDSLGLSAAIEWQAEDFQARTGIHCEAVLPEEEFVLERAAATGLFRIVQESLTNIVRHAQATHVDIILELNGDELELDIEDNGVGFDENQMKDPHSLGLLGMRERALLLDGKFEIHGCPGKGTRVSVSMPMKGHGRILERVTPSEERAVLL